MYNSLQHRSQRKQKNTLKTRTLNTQHLRTFKKANGIVRQARTVIKIHVIFENSRQDKIEDMRECLLKSKQISF